MLSLQTAFLCIINGVSFHPKPSAVISPPFATNPVLHLSICLCPETWGSITITCPVPWDITEEVGLLDLPHFMVPWLLYAHMVGDYGRPFKHPVDEIIQALWGMYWHHKHCALSCPLGPIMRAIFLKLLVRVKPVSLKHRLIGMIAVKSCCK